MLDLRSPFFVFEAFFSGCSRGLGRMTSERALVPLEKLLFETLVCKVPIAKLAPVSGGYDCYSRRDVGEPDGGFDFVPVLAARTARTKGLDLRFPLETMAIRNAGHVIRRDRLF